MELECDQVVSIDRWISHALLSHLLGNVEPCMSEFCFVTTSFDVISILVRRRDAAYFITGESTLVVVGNIMQRAIDYIQSKRPSSAFY